MYGEFAYAVAIDDAGGVFVVGETESFGAGGEDVFLLGYSPAGALLWQKTWGASDSEWVHGLTVDRTGWLYLAGGSADAYGSWGDADGADTSASGTETTPTWSDSPVNGSGTDVSGTEGIPDGVEDVGGGSTDALIMKVNPHEW